LAAAFVLSHPLATAVPGLAASLVSQTVWGTQDNETVEGAATAADGSTYLTGIHGVRARDLDPPRIFVVKFAPDRSVAWQETWDGPDPLLSDNARDVAVAPGGDSVYVTGTSFVGTSDTDPHVAVLLKLNASDGTLEWGKSWGGDAAPEGVAVGSDGSVYVAGTIRLGSIQREQIFITKFNQAGAVLWHQIWYTLFGLGDNPGLDVAVDGAGNVYVTGLTDRPDPLNGGWDVALLKIDPAGTLIWQRTVAAGKGVDPRGGLALAPDGSVYVAGGRIDERTSDLNLLVLKFGSDGSLVWNRNWGGGGDDAALGISVGADGMVFVSGGTNSYGSGSEDAFLLQLDPGGKVMDAMTWGGIQSERGDAISIDVNGNVVIGATVDIPPYSLLRAPTKISKDRAVLGTPNYQLISRPSDATDSGGTVEAIAATSHDVPAEGGLALQEEPMVPRFDAALVIIAP
jgi:hypothetical protein